MGAVSREMVDQLQDMDVEELLQGLDLHDLPRRDDIKLQRKRKSLTMTVPAPVWHDSQHTLDEPGAVDVVYWEEHGVMVVDIGGDLSAGE